MDNRRKYKLALWHRAGGTVRCCGLVVLFLMVTMVGGVPLRGQNPLEMARTRPNHDGLQPATKAVRTPDVAPVVAVREDAPPRRAVKGHYTFGIVIDGDTIPLYHLREVTVYASGMLLTPKEIKNNAKMIRNVRLMLPYARAAKNRLDALEAEIASLPKKQRKEAIKKAEQQLKDDYKDQLSKYTFSQGLVLIKLIDRETSRTAYSLVGDLRGTFRASLYQTLARLFGYNLKTKYDPQHDKKDELMERIVKSIERGQL